MKEKKRAIRLILALALVLGMTVGAAGAAILSEKSITVHSGVSIFVDGRELHPVDVNGDPVDAFIYEGTTYVPLRAVGEALGAEVKWDSPSKTVYLSSNTREGEPVVRYAKYNAGSGTITYTCGPMDIDSEYCKARVDGFFLIDSWFDLSDASYVDISRYYDVFAIIKGTVFRTEKDYFLAYISCYDKDGVLLRCNKVYEPLRVEDSKDFMLRILLSIPSTTTDIVLSAERPY